MTHPNKPNSNPAGLGAILTDLAPDMQELCAEDAQSVRGGLLSTGKLDGDGKALKITDGTSNTVIFSLSVTQSG